MKNLIQSTTVFATLIILMSSCLTTGAGKHFSKHAEDVSYDAIIVPGYPFEDGQWSTITKLRVYWAAYLYKNGKTKNIIFSGSSVYSPYVESKIMSLYAQELGIPAANIYTEEQAEHSSENLYYSYKMAKKIGFEKIALATDPFQNSFLHPFVKKMGLDDLGSLPIEYKNLKWSEMTTPEIDASKAYVEDFVSLNLRQDKRTRKKGTQGLFIQYEEGDSPKEIIAQEKARYRKGKK